MKRAHGAKRRAKISAPSAKIIAWARTAPREYGVHCRTCRQSPEVVEAIREIVELIKRGESVVSVRQILEHLNAEMGATLTLSSLRNHVSNCLGVSVGKLL